MEPDAVEIRVLGCLIEKQRTTPGSYPLTLNSLLLACNQSTNRDPVLDLDESEIRGALERLGQRRWARLASWSSGRSMKYRHLLGETLGLGDAELSVLSVLMLRGPQTPGELRQRTERQYRFGDEQLAATLATLQERGLVRVLPRRPGQREQRYEQLLGDAPDAAPPSVEAPAAAPASSDPVGNRVGALEAELAALRDEVRALREELGA